MAKAFFKLLETDAVIQRNILKALAAEINSSMRSNAKKMLNPFKSAVSSALMSSPEIDALRGGELRYDFGVPAGFDVATPVVDAIAEAVTLEIKPIKLMGSAFQGGISLLVQPADFTNLLSLSVATIITAKGMAIPWLEWLLKAGDGILIADFGVRYGAGLGRSGGAHMKTSMRPFKVNSAFSGTADNNFISRALMQHQSQLENIIARNM